MTSLGKNETAVEQPDYFPSFRGLSSILDLIAAKAFHRDLLYITQPLAYIRVEALKKGTSFPQPTTSSFRSWERIACKLFLRGKKRLVKHSNMVNRRGREATRKRDRGQEGGRAVLMPTGTADGHRLEVLLDVHWSILVHVIKLATEDLAKRIQHFPFPLI